MSEKCPECNELIPPMKNRCACGWQRHPKKGGEIKCSCGMYARINFNHVMMCWQCYEHQQRMTANEDWRDMDARAKRKELGIEDGDPVVVAQRARELFKKLGGNLLLGGK